MDRIRIFFALFILMSAVAISGMAQAQGTARQKPQEEYRARCEAATVRERARVEAEKLARAQKKALQAKIKILYKTGTVYYSTEQYDLAETAFNEILALDPENLLAKQYLKKIKARLRTYPCKKAAEDRARERQEKITLSH